MKCNYKVKRSVFRIRLVQDLGLIPGLGRSPGEGKGYSLQYSGLENSTVHGGSQRAVHNWAAVTFTFQIKNWLPGKGLPWCLRPGFNSWTRRSSGKGNDNPLQYSCLENFMDRGTWQATVHGIGKSWTRLSD